MTRPQARIAVLGGSGLYAMAGLERAEEVHARTPFGDPSDAVRIGELGGERVAFLARHGRQHRLSPSEINYRANIFALKELGVERILSASAVGSLRESIHPRDVVLIDQFIDRTRRREDTFFGGGLVAHVGIAEPICREVRAVLHDAAVEHGARAHEGGTYLCIEGPAFSTVAESRLYRTWGADVIGMTNVQEAKLAREAEICYATLALVTDYDVWHGEEEAVSVATVLDHLRANAELAVRTLATAAARLPHARTACDCATALRNALLTPLDAVPEETLARLAPLIDKYRPSG